MGQVGRRLGRDALLVQDLERRFGGQRGGDQLGVVVQRRLQGRHGDRGPEGVGIAVEQPVEGEDGMIAVENLGSHLVARHGLGGLDLQPIHLAGLADPVAVIDRLDHGAQPDEVLLGDLRLAVSQGQTVQGDRQVAPQGLGLRVGGQPGAGGVGGRDLARQFRPAEEGQLLVHAVSQISVFGGLEAARGRGIDPEGGGRILPLAHGVDRGGRSLRLGSGRLQGWIVELAFINKLIKQFWSYRQFAAQLHCRGGPPGARRRCEASPG